MKNLLVKFGGSSVADKEKIESVAKILKELAKNNRLVCVVSAMGDTTDELIAKAKSINKNPNKRELDALLSSGEIISSSLLAMALENIGQKAISLSGLQAGFKTYGKHGFSKILDIDTKRIEEELDQGKVVVVAGFQGVNEENDITTLGRGGSDTSAVALAAKLKAACKIFTDVDGIYNVDPRFYPAAKKLDQISYEETMEMAHLGAKVIDPRAVEMAQKYGVELEIALNTGKVKGTIISEGDNLEKSIITSVSAVDEILLVNKELNNFKISELFAKLADRGINIDVINQTEIGEKSYVSFTSTLDEKENIKTIADDFEFIENVSKVSVIGNAMRNETGVAARIFGVLNDKEIKFYQVSTSKISVSIIVDTKIKDQVMKVLIEEFNI
ncbi:aspartate kinase [Peptoniphilus obesi]|uniref:aspartate kinase n=1 Tax=Peptoniphilus obesi TaxID=1472765 RepID=UPI0004B7D18F|nr:aspartate kinase [Peptoniphilus obesi]